MRPVPCPRRRELFKAQLSTKRLLYQKPEEDNKRPTVSHLSIGITTRSAATLLDMESTTITSSANRVSLRMSFTERGSTLGLQANKERIPSAQASFNGWKRNTFPELHSTKDDYSPFITRTAARTGRTNK